MISVPTVVRADGRRLPDERSEVRRGRIRSIAAQSPMSEPFALHLRQWPATCYWKRLVYFRIPYKTVTD